MRGDGGVAGEGRVVGVLRFHSWGKCSLVPRQLFAERESSLVNCLYRFGSNILKLP